MSGIDWKAELKKLEREFDGLPPEPKPAVPRATRPVQEPAVSVQEVTPLGVWARLFLVVLLAGALPFWPYARECGALLYGYMGAGSMVAVGGLWASVASWRCRTGFAHTLAMALIVLGLGLVAHQVLPRVGYARTDPADPQAWQCPAPPAAQEEW